MAENVGYYVSLVIFTAIYALFSLGLNLQWGFTGLINFGHVAFMTIGAYATVLLSLQNVPLAVAVLIGAALAAFLGLLIGFATLRLREDYLSIVTIGVSEVLRLVALNEEWLTRGSFGVQNFPLPLETFRPTLLSRYAMIGILTVIVGLAYWQLWRWVQRRLRKIPAHTWFREPTLLLTIACATFGLFLYGVCAVALYNFSQNPARNGLMLVSVVVLALVFWRLEWLVRSPWGRVLKAIREDEEVAKALGKNVFWYKLQSLMLGGFIAGIAGALFAWQLSTVYPENFAPLITFYGWTIVVLGGAGNNVGTILGAVVFWAYFTVTRFLPDLVRTLHTVIPAIPAQVDDARLGAFRIMLIGVLLIVLMMLRPQGILGKKEELTLGR
ncbi:branched-chain amino acid ABC transporter permease [Leptolyngbya sp. FACHB-36]|uniref:branched-chain amino acid ABC transporter permease n=1 Tax=Leptolyngbya sp. FACHB-36 TaxID=2692808 RepID=UPI0016816ED7|nr:branched-chain amino acid ABC transporter permease [Leptolyngbya sp. FACHB-36]MBD2022618.1 branched-chain amino acid ABC transporter permease [Leptolyngbya sp. FACHB-36]